MSIWFKLNTNSFYRSTLYYPLLAKRIHILCLSLYFLKQFKSLIQRRISPEIVIKSASHLSPFVDASSCRLQFVCLFCRLQLAQDLELASRAEFEPSSPLGLLFGQPPPLPSPLPLTLLVYYGFSRQSFLLFQRATLVSKTFLPTHQPHRLLVSLCPWKEPVQLT